MIDPASGNRFAGADARATATRWRIELAADGASEDGTNPEVDMKNRWGRIGSHRVWWSSARPRLKHRSEIESRRSIA
jgi:hypothetical protein